MSKKTKSIAKEEKIALAIPDFADDIQVENFLTFLLTLKDENSEQIKLFLWSPETIKDETLAVQVLKSIAIAKFILKNEISILPPKELGPKFCEISKHFGATTQDVINW